jgi:hypothetical protein
MATINIIRQLILYGAYYFTQHALEELDKDALDEFDAETAILYGKIRRSWPREHKYEIIGPSNDDRVVGVVCRITQTNKLRIITSYEDKK